MGSQMSARPQTGMQPMMPQGQPQGGQGGIGGMVAPSQFVPPSVMNTTGAPPPQPGTAGQGTLYGQGTGVHSPGFYASQMVKHPGHSQGYWQQQMARKPEFGGMQQQSPQMPMQQTSQQQMLAQIMSMFGVR